MITCSSHSTYHSVFTSYSANIGVIQYHSFFTSANWARILSQCYMPAYTDNHRVPGGTLKEIACEISWQYMYIHARMIYVDGLARLPLSAGGQSVLYADDLLLFRHIRNQEDYHQLQHDVSMIEDWVNSNYLTLNTAKCKYMVVSRKRCPPAPVSLALGGTELEKVDCFKYLGVLLCNDMSFSKHIESICTKARK